MISRALALNEKEVNNIEDLVRRYLEIYKGCFLKNTRLFPNTIETLETLKSLGCTLIIVSNKSEYFVKNY